MHSAVSGALVVEKEVTNNNKTTKQQLPAYFVSEVLIGSKKFYSKLEKNCYTVSMSARKLQHYFEVHTIKDLTNETLNEIFGNRDSSSRISKWAMELSEHVVDFKKRSAIKSQILADLGVVPESRWLVYCDGAWGIGAGAAAILISPSRIKLRYITRLQFNSEAGKCTNNIT
jgi:hypothetical protein